MEYEVITNIDMRCLDEESELIYHEKLKSVLESEYKSKIVAIEVDSADYFIGNTVVEAGLEAKEKYPDKIFQFIRIGYPGVYKRNY